MRSVRTTVSSCRSKHVVLNRVIYANFFSEPRATRPPHWTIHIASGANPVTLHARHQQRSTTQTQKFLLKKMIRKNLYRIIFKMYRQNTRHWRSQTRLLFVHDIVSSMACRVHGKFTSMSKFFYLLPVQFRDLSLIPSKWCQFFSFIYPFIYSFVSLFIQSIHYYFIHSLIHTFILSRGLLHLQPSLRKLTLRFSRSPLKICFVYTNTICMPKEIWGLFPSMFVSSFLMHITVISIFCIQKCDSEKKLYSLISALRLIDFDKSSMKD